MVFITYDTIQKGLKELFIFLFLNFILTVITTYLFTLNPYNGNICKENSFIGLIFLAPIIEELIFRLPLYRSKLNYFISIVSCVVFFSKFFRIISIDLFYFLIFLIFILYVLIRYLKSEKQKYNFNHKYKSIIFSFLFGLFHLLNFDKKYVLTFNLAILFYILHKSIIGYFLSNIRIKYNVFISILFHLIMNLIFFLLMQLKQ